VKSFNSLMIAVLMAIVISYGCGNKKAKETGHSHGPDTHEHGEGSHTHGSGTHFHENEAGIPYGQEDFFMGDSLHTDSLKHDSLDHNHSHGHDHSHGHSHDHGHSH
jgi:hypothetical protein